MSSNMCKAMWLLLTVAGASTASAQLSNSEIKGTVVDGTSSVVPNAALTLTNTETGETRSDHTNKSGYFDFAALPPGQYTVSATSEGFATWQGRLTLRVAQTTLVQPVLKLASASTTIDVVDVTAVINRVDPTISDVKEAARIESLPLQNRNFLNILNFTPGVVSNSFAGQGGGYTRVNGIVGGSLDYLVDGQTAVERFTNELQRTPQPLPTIQELKVTTSNGSAEYSRPGLVEVVTKSGSNQLHGQFFELNQISALQAKTLGQTSVNFLVHNEFGGNLGGPVYLPKLYNGHNKTFFFVDIESVRERSAANGRYTVPLAAWKSGDFSSYVDTTGAPVVIYDPLTTTFSPATGSYVRQPFAGNKIPAARINPIAAKIMTYIPDPNVNIPYYEGQNYQIPNLRAKDDRTLITAKVDQIFGQQRLSARYTYTDENVFGNGYFLNPRVRLNGGHNGAISYTHVITPNLVNETRAGVQLFHAYSGPQLISPPITQTLGLPTYPGTVAWPSFYYEDPTNGYLFDGIDRDNPKNDPTTSINFANNLSWNIGKHSLKGGFGFQYVAVTTEEVGQPGGDYSFSGSFTGQMDPSAASQGIYNQQLPNSGFALADFLLGLTDYAALNVYPVFHTRQNYYSGYLQDDWKITPKLILNLGLRYEYWTPFKDKDGRAATLNFSNAGGPTVVFPGSGQPNVDPAVLTAYQAGGLRFQSAQAAGLPTDLWSMAKNNLGPRFGFAYQANEKTVLRGGYGIYYWAMPLVQYHQNTRKNAPFSYSYQSLVDNNDGAAAELEFPVGTNYSNQSPTARQLGTTFINPSALSIAENSGWNILPWDPDYKPQKVQEFNLTLERELPKHLGARISYVGNHTDNLVMYDPINALLPRRLAAAGATIQQRRAFPHFATSSINAMDLMRFNGFANASLLQAEVKQQVNKDWIVQGSYVFQHVLTTSEGSNNSYGGLEMLPSALTGNASSEARLYPVYANDSQLPRQTVSFNTHYVLPFGRGKAYLNQTNGLVDRIVSGWNISAFYYWRSGLYFSPYYANTGSAYLLAPGKNGELPHGQRTRAHWFDSAVNRADLGDAYKSESYIRRANPLDNDFRNNIPRSAMTGPGFNNMDATVAKITPLTERFTFNLEAQVFNVYNHVNMDLPNNQGSITTQVGRPRLVQLQGKIVF